jgi:hypothetical protein
MHSSLLGDTQSLQGDTQTNVNRAAYRLNDIRRKRMQDARRLLFGSAQRTLLIIG